ncbi:Ribonuclease Zc3h12a-like [Ostreococcus tauri]|uniref:Ribonuclease Zc3h12a-like n=1 Tax=Ostreococcus tauri TaxID=70448 RepID=Q00XV5_OSTTA|nr:Ribonuclease Zc3h12a-like [Ostreococcus tauri]CAL57296.1 Ribonuclease Zc3h12a-like [Ostreococcus tauri]|eukprot:XP_003082350.1 Ribonuclease Zc3h12a-like [Ostreococcus tauri]
MASSASPGRASTATTPTPTTPRAGRRARGTAARDASVTGAASTARRLVVVDGANVAWGYAAALRAAYGSASKQPLSRGVVEAVARCERAGFEVVCFVPRTYVEGALHGLADGGDLNVVVARHVVYLGGGVWRNERLRELVERGRVRCVERKGNRGADDLACIAYAFAEDAEYVVSNDRYNDHRSSEGSAIRQYLKRSLRDYEFTFGSDADEVRRAAGDASTVGVGSHHLPSPPAGEGTEWDAKTHAPGSSRPWACGPKDGIWGARPRTKKRRAFGKAARTRRPEPSEMDMGFPFWAVDDEALPCVFSPSCNF